MSCLLVGKFLYNSTNFFKRVLPKIFAINCQRKHDVNGRYGLRITFMLQFIRMVALRKSVRKSKGNVDFFGKFPTEDNS